VAANHMGEFSLFDVLNQEGSKVLGQTLDIQRDVSYNFQHLFSAISQLLSSTISNTLS
jgi:hypothetical protein